MGSMPVGRYLKLVFTPRLLMAIPFQAIPIGLYVFLTAQFGPQRLDDMETRCRKCQYILNGISEPRCPECGERI